MKELLSIIEMHGKAKACGKKMVLATVLQVEGSAYRRPGAHMLVVEGGSITGSVSGGCLERDVIEQSMLLMQTGAACKIIKYNTSHDDDALLGTGTGCTGTVTIKIEKIDESNNIEMISEQLGERLHLFIFGGGHDAPALAQLACHMGMRITVLDHRSGFALANRFPPSAKVMHYKPEDQSTWPQLDGRSYCAVMAHNLNVDKQVLSNLLEDSSAAYIGVLGPKKRTENMLRQIRESGKEIKESQLNKLHAPIGLDIGAESPDQIALAVLAEIHAVAAGRGGGFLRDRAGAIHDASLDEPAPCDLVSVDSPLKKQNSQCSIQH